MSFCLCIYECPIWQFIYGNASQCACGWHKNACVSERELSVYVSLYILMCSCAGAIIHA